MAPRSRPGRVGGRTAGCTRFGTGASRMIEPLPLACGDGSPDVLASPVFRNRLNAMRVVEPMSKQRPLTEYLPSHHHATYRRAWSLRFQPASAMLSARARAICYHPSIRPEPSRGAHRRGTLLPRGTCRASGTRRRHQGRRRSPGQGRCRVDGHNSAWLPPNLSLFFDRGNQYKKSDTLSSRTDRPLSTLG